jgi:hypothetical protein
MTSLPSVLTIIILFVASALWGQDEGYKNWMIREILKDAAFVGNIYSETSNGLKRFYWPDDVPIPSQDNPSDGDHLFKSDIGIFTALEGTGRIYKIEADTKNKNKLSFIRQDSTSIIGYNHGAVVFFDQDTLYSLGGYGIWNLSYILRYFRQSTYGWEVLPVNLPIKQLYIPSKSFYDKSTRCYFNLDFDFFTEGLKSGKKLRSGKIKQDSIYVRRLNISTKNWDTPGVVNPEALQIMETTTMVGASPWGNMLSAGDRFNNSFYLINYSTNRILEIKDKKVGAAIRDAWLSGVNPGNFPERIISYFHNDSLKILNSNKQKFTFRLVYDDFVETPHTIWIPGQTNSILSIAALKQFFPCVGLISFFAGLGFFFYSRKIMQQPEKNEDFDRQEIRLIHSISTKAGFIAKPDEIDQLLDENVGRSLEALKKRRSILIRSINKKYSDQYDDDEDLIRTERLDSDRRMVQYIMDPKKYARISRSIQDK